MAVGIVFVGMLVGTFAATAALVAGGSFWWALAIYSGLGLLGTLGAVFLLLRQPAEPAADERGFLPLGG